MPNYTRCIFNNHEENFQDLRYRNTFHYHPDRTKKRELENRNESNQNQSNWSDDRDAEIIRKMARTVLKFATTLSRTASGAANHPSGKKLFIRLFPIFVMAALYRYLSFILNHVTTRAAVF